MIPKIFTKRPHMVVAFMLAVGLLATFGQNLPAPAFIAHESSILRLPLLAQWKNIPLIFSRDFLMFSDGQFRPLSYAVLAIVRTVSAPENVFFWHIWLLTFHWLNAILVSVLVRHFCRHLGSAVFAAAIFALHPLASVVVNNINNFHYVLGLTFYLGVLCCYLSFVRTSRRQYYVAGVVLFILGLLTSKVVLTLPIVLGVYELFYRRSELRTVLVRLVPFAAFVLVISPFWLLYKPHPFYYKYIEFPSGAVRNSFFSVVGATGWYAKGLLLGRDIPVVLYEVVERIFGFPNWKFLLWGIVDLGILIAAGWVIRRKYWAGLGVVILLTAMLPFASTAWNGVENYVSWAYLYVPIVGLALLVGGLIDALWSSNWSWGKKIAWRDLRPVVLAVLCLIVFYYGVQQVRINLASRSELKYWRRVLQLDLHSENASLELGKAHLEREETAQALGMLFSPTTKKLQDPCLSMSRYYCEQGDFLAAAIHLRMVESKKDGIQFQTYETAKAKLMYAAGALDYAEGALGTVLMANPYNLAAMEQLTEIWVCKGYVPAAERLMGRALEIAPSYPSVVRMRTMLETQKNISDTSEVSQMIYPPEPSWLRYVIQGVSDPLLREAIIQASERHVDDPVIQTEAGICLVRNGKPKRALSKLEFVTQKLPLCAHPWAIKCWAATRAGAYSQAEIAGRHAMELDPQNPAVHNILGILLSTVANNPQDPTYRGKLDLAIRHYEQVIQLDPRCAVAYSNLGNLLGKQGKVDEAIKHYRQALRIKSDLVDAHNNLGFALAQQGKLDEAIKHYRQALHTKSDFVEAHNNLGIALAQQEKLEEAIDHFQQALRLKPDYVDVHHNLGNVLAKQGRHGEATHHFKQALRINPDYTRTLYSLVMELKKQRQFGEAIRVLRERLSRAPNELGATMNLAWLLATCPKPELRNGTEAAQLVERICEKRGYKNPFALDVLAAAYAESGRFDEAIQVTQQAVQLAMSSGQTKLGKQIEVRLELYKAHRPYHEQP